MGSGLVVGEPRDIGEGLVWWSFRWAEPTIERPVARDRLGVPDA